MKTSDHLPTCSSTKTNITILIILLAVASIMPFNRVIAQNSNNFTIGTTEAKPGEKVTGSLSVEAGIDEATFIPFTIINGAKPGPTLTLVAGIHGTEYVPIITAQKLAQQINPYEISGTLLIIQIANIPSFQERAVYYNPIDRKNQNRVFPGKKDGTISERIAYTLKTEIMHKSDYYIDMHGGEVNEQIVDYVYYCANSPKPDICRKSKMLAHAIGNKYLIPDDYNAYSDSMMSEYSEVEAFRQGAAAISLEWGDRGIVKSEEVEAALQGLKNVMMSIGMLEGTPVMNDHPVYLVNEQSVESAHDGILYTFVERGQYLIQGTRIGYTTDYWGNMLEEYLAPISGVVIAVKVAPSIKQGETVFRIGEPRANADE